LNFTEFLVVGTIICGNMRGFCVKLEGQGLIWNYFPNSRGLDVNFHKGLGLQVDIGKDEGPK
jgi:hypothetical protein